MGNRQNKSTGSALGFEATLWATADKLRGNLDAAEYKHVVLGLIFLKYNQSGEGEIRKAIIEADLVDCMVALPGQLFYSTQIPVCLWFLARNKSVGASFASFKYRDRRGQTLFLDVRKMGRIIDRVQRDLAPEDIAKITGTYHAWRGDKGASKYEDIAGFCKSAKLDEIRTPRVCAHARPLRRCGGSRRRRRTVRAKDETAHCHVGIPIRGIGQAGEGDSEEPQNTQPCLTE
jgi:type I restriction-modification system DNA methylase subunit